MQYQWIRFDELYKQMKSFFQISKSIFELNTLFQNNSNVGFLYARWRRRHLCLTAGVLVPSFCCCMFLFMCVRLTGPSSPSHVPRWVSVMQAHTGHSILLLGAPAPYHEVSSPRCPTVFFEVTWYSLRPPWVVYKLKQLVVSIFLLELLCYSTLGYYSVHICAVYPEPRIAKWPGCDTCFWGVHK